MLNENAKKWVDALRSGEFKQGTGALRRGDEFCCLGVACELAVRAGVIGASPDHEVYDGEALVLPFAVREWLGLYDDDGSFIPEPEAPRSLVSANDDYQKDFDAIAAIIESEPEGLFRKLSK